MALFCAQHLLLSVCEIHPCCCTYQQFHPFHCWVVLHLSFIHPPVNGHYYLLMASLGQLQIMLLWRSAYKSLCGQLLFFLERYLGGGAEYSKCMLNFTRNWSCFPKWLYHYTFPSAKHKDQASPDTCLPLLMSIF